MSIAICPGSFDPITLGHLNIIRRTSRIFDEVIVLVMVNSNKSTPMFSIEERLSMVERAVERYPNVTVNHVDGLLAEYAKKLPNAVLVKGLRKRSIRIWRRCSSPAVRNTRFSVLRLSVKWHATAETLPDLSPAN